MNNTLGYSVLPNGLMRITRKSPLTGKDNTMDMPLTLDKLMAFANDGGQTLIQRLLPELNVDQREFLKTGYTIEDWTTMFPPAQIIDTELARTTTTS